MKKTLWLLSTMAILLMAGLLGWQCHTPTQKRLLRTAEDIVFTDADSAARLLAQVNTTRLTENSQMLYDLLRALVHEEQWYLSHADTAVCISSDAETWNFRREMGNQKEVDLTFPDDSTLLRVFHYYEQASLGGTSDDKDDLRRFGRICFVLSRHQSEKIQSTRENRLFHLAIHCAERTEDHALAYRAYDKYANHLPLSSSPQSELYQRRALEHYRLSPDQPRWLLTMLNDYGFMVLLYPPFDLHNFGSLERTAAIAARHAHSASSPLVCDSIYQRLDSLWALPHADLSPTCALRITKSTSIVGDITVPVGMYEDALQEQKEDSTKHRQPSYENAKEWSEQEFATDRDTYLASGYVQKTAMLQRRLMATVIIILALTMLVLLLVFWNWRNHIRRRHEAEQAAHQLEANQLTERLRQKDAMIAMLRGHIMDKSEILDMLEPAAGKRTIINARNWREIEMTLDTADGNFVSRLRAEHPQFSEEDIRLCMLARLQLSNTALSAIYVISVSAVQHRKQKLKKEGFGVNDPNVTLDQIIANF